MRFCSSSFKPSCLSIASNKVIPPVGSEAAGIPPAGAAAVVPTVGAAAEEHPPHDPARHPAGLNPILLT